MSNNRVKYLIIWPICGLAGFVFGVVMHHQTHRQRNSGPCSPGYILRMDGGGGIYCHFDDISLVTNWADWQKCPSGSYMSSDGGCQCPKGASERGGECELTEFVPDLPERMWQIQVVDTPVWQPRIEFTNFRALNITDLRYLNCMYVNGRRVRFVVYAGGKRDRVRCKQNQFLGDGGRGEPLSLRPIDPRDLPEIKVKP